MKEKGFFSGEKEEGHLIERENNNLISLSMERKQP
jgi:hypothetical protein